MSDSEARKKRLQEALIRVEAVYDLHQLGKLGPASISLGLVDAIESLREAIGLPARPNYGLSTDTNADYVAARVSGDREDGLREAAQAMLAHHDRQNGVHAGSPNDCEQGRNLRAALAARLQAKDPA